MTYFLDNVEPPPPNRLEPSFTTLVSELFQKLDAVRKESLPEGVKTITEQKSKIISSYIELFKTNIGNNFYQTSILVFPEKAGRLYYCKEIFLARLIVKIFKIPKQSDDYTTLMNFYKNYQASKRFAVDAKNFRDFALQASRVISDRRKANPEIKEYTINDINQELDKLSNTQKSDKQIKILEPLFNHLKIEEVRWLIHIILRKAILSNLEIYMFNQWHPDGYRLYKICNNLKLTFYTLTDVNKRVPLEDLKIHPMYRFKPMLSVKLTKDYQKLITNTLQKKHEMNQEYENLYNQMHLQSKFYIEEKMDGDRMILHYENNHFMFFSRRLKDYSFLYGRNYNSGSLTKYLKGAFPNQVTSIILDGEMVAYDYERKAILPFGTLKSSAIQESVRQFNTTDSYELFTSYPLFIIFDVLYLNGKDLTNYPLFFRKNLLQKLITPVPNRFEIHKPRIGETARDIEKAIREVISQRSEGLIVKHCQSKYLIDGFRNPDWIKVKPEYLERFGENLDLVIIGMNPQIKNSFMMGLKNEVDGSYYSFCFVANGITTEDYDKINRILHNKWKNIKKEFPPDNLIKFGTRLPDYWIDPKDSIVLEVRARSIDVRPEKTYAVGSSLHNNFCRRIRDDKSVDECISLQQYLELKQNYYNDVLKSQKAATKKRGLNILTSFNDANQQLKKTKVESNLFKGFEFLILSDKRDEITGDLIKSDELKMLVKKYGGTLVGSIDAKTNLQVLIITEKFLPLAEVYLKRGLDLIKPNWIFECINRNCIVQLEPIFILDTKDWNPYNDKVDKFGDSFIIHHSLSNLPFPKLNQKKLTTLKESFEWVNKPLVYLFENTTFYVLDDGSLDGFVLKEKIERFSGELIDDYLNCYYIVVPKKHEINVDIEIDSMFKEISDSVQFENGKLISRIPVLVNENFIDKCIELNSIADPDDYKYIKDPGDQIKIKQEK
ncbi:unnamed protein product [Candida verbasci]|uniref:DNA ligase n=1 Tax=Candida verbasci TaxID=1227364 RepID=A0A9W4X8L2_9ASCO|nr:unnamed protein product [Candida verbasci]